MGDIEMRSNKKNSGFTLVEILIVVVILGILAAIVIPQFTQASTEARENSLKANLQTIRSQIELYKIQHNDDPPTSVATFEDQMTGTTDSAGATTGSDFGPYLQSIPVNPFTNDNELDATPGNAGDDGGDWEYVAATGAFHADDSGTDSDGVTAHADY